MTDEEFKSLQPGDLIRHKTSRDEPYLVHGNYGRYVTAVRTVDASNPDEWDLVLKVTERIRVMAQ